MTLLLLLNEVAKQNNSTLQFNIIQDVQTTAMKPANAPYNVYMLWFNFILGSIFIFLCFYTRYHTLPKENKN